MGCEYDPGQYPCGCSKWRGHSVFCELNHDFSIYDSGFDTQWIDHHKFWVCEECGCLVAQGYTDKHREKCVYVKKEDDDE